MKEAGYREGIVITVRAGIARVASGNPIVSTGIVSLYFRRAITRFEVAERRTAD